MKDDLRSPIQHHLILRLMEPGHGVTRVCSLMIEKDLFGTIRLVVTTGKTGSRGHERVTEYPDELEAGAALEEIARTMRRRGYVDL